MEHFSTNLMSALIKGESVEAVMRGELESAVNELLRLELTSFLDYEKHNPIVYKSGNSRNGVYQRQLRPVSGKSRSRSSEIVTVN